MKKAKIMLTAIAVLAVVGGALAFKARQNPNLFYCATVNGVPNICTTSPYSSISGNPTTYPITRLYTTGQVGLPCSATNCTVNPAQRFLQP